MKIGVILSGCGVYDGSEIHEATFALLAVAEAGHSYQCYAPDMNQHHVINHLTGEEMNQQRNVLVESARIARGEVQNITAANMDELDALFIPGGFGAAKNLTQWAFSGPDGEIVPEVQQLIRQAVELNKPIIAACMGPTVVAKALENTDTQASLSVGSTAAASPYDIEAISAGMEKAGAKAQMCTLDRVEIDTEHKIISAPCYMMEASIVDVYRNMKMAVEALDHF